MATLVFGMNVSLDGFVDHDKFEPDAELFRHFIAQVRDISGAVYGRHIYELMRYWENDDAAWSPDYRAFADAWRKQPKWVASRTLTDVGPGATLISHDVEAFVRELKAERNGEIRICGTQLAASLTAAGLIDAYELYVDPAVLGSGKPFFANTPPPLRLVESERIGERAVRSRYVVG